mmetsp:Transcript_17095/g.24981  ORF Transcript_17095/g.24981 Transcript_17095/m.24981 type:complete len:211 (-) Transcript_17095:715-1347(-)
MKHLRGKLSGPSTRVRRTFQRLNLNRIKSMLLILLVGVVLVCLVKVLGQYYIPVLTDCAQASLLADGRNVCCTDLLGSVHVVLEVEVLTEVHLAGAGLEHQALLAPIRVRELDLPVQAPGAQQGGVQGVGAVGGHDHLHRGGLVEPVHLVQELQQNALDLSVCSSLCIKTLGGDGINFIDEHNRRAVLLGKAEDVTHHTRTLAQVFLHKL